VVFNNLGESINTPYDDAVPRISMDGKILYFKSFSRGGGKGGEDIWYAERLPDGNFGNANAFNSLNTENHEALHAISGDGNIAILFGNYIGSFGKGDLFYSVNTPGGWTYPCNIGGSVNSDKWESQATLGPDGKTLIFCSDRQGGFGESDIYITFLEENKWTKPINLGSNINTRGKETRPFLAADNKTLYFSSNGHFGFGGSDIFFARRIGNSWTEWSTPYNMGKYINTIDDDEDLTVPSSGATGYTVKYNIAGGYGDYDIYSFTLPLEMRPDYVFNIYGKVLSEEDSAICAIIRFYDYSSKEEIAKIISHPTDGSYRIALTPGKRYYLTVDMKDYLYIYDEIDLTDPAKFYTREYIRQLLNEIKQNKTALDIYNKNLQTLLNNKNASNAEIIAKYEEWKDQYGALTHSLNAAVNEANNKLQGKINSYTELEKNIYMQKLTIGASFKLRNILFDFGKSSLRSESEPELMKLYQMMLKSDISIILGGHTDHVGKAEKNQTLSQDRVNAVRQFIIDKGIDSTRITAIGYGEAKPIASNKTELGKQQNRRVEALITEIKPRKDAEELKVEEIREFEKDEKIKGNYADFLLNLQKAAINGGIPKNSPCSTGIDMYLKDETSQKNEQQPQNQ